MNYSKQRETILSVLRATTCHPTAEWVYTEVKKQIPNISLGTVYRNLALLEEAKKIMKVQGVFDKDHYDGNATNHAHFICKSCGAVLDTDVSESIKKQILNNVNFKADDFTLVYYGICDKCKNNSL